MFDVSIVRFANSRCPKGGMALQFHSYQFAHRRWKQIVISYISSIDPKELQVIFLRRWIHCRIQRREIHLKYKIDFVVFL